MPSYAKDVQKIFVAHCGKCHGAGSSHTRFAATYAAAIALTDYCDPGSPTSVGACSLTLIEDKTMPPGTLNIALSMAELNVLKAWVNTGEKP